MSEQIRRTSSVTQMVAGGVLVALGFWLGSATGQHQKAFASPQTATRTEWGIALPAPDAYAVVKGADGWAYIVSQNGWRQVGDKYKQGPLNLY